jgi:hypothetical protein
LRLAEPPTSVDRPGTRLAEPLLPAGEETPFAPAVEPLDSLRWHWEDSSAVAEEPAEAPAELASTDEPRPVAWSSPKAWGADLAIGQPPASSSAPILEVAREPDETESPDPAVAAAPSPLESESAKRRAHEVADRLERIARALRERGPTGALLDDAADPLGAFVTGYVLGSAGKPVESPLAR